MINRFKQREDTSLLPGAAYIRFSSEMQSDSFSLDAQLRQIKEQAERDGVEIVKLHLRKSLRTSMNPSSARNCGIVARRDVPAGA